MRLFTDAGIRHSRHAVVSMTLGCYPSQVGRGNEEIVAVTREARRGTLRERRANGANGLPLLEMGIVIVLVGAPAGEPEFFGLRVGDFRKAWATACKEAGLA